jgi:hypothetical protein
MPVEVRELIIRATVGAPRGAEPGESEPRERELEDIVATCVAQVLEILRSERER